jgi:hypothetical protein
MSNLLHDTDDTSGKSEATVSATDVPEFSIDFHIKEWEALREEVRWQVDHTRRLELATVAGLGFYYAWFASTKSHIPSYIVLSIPVLLVSLAGLRAWGTLIRTQQIDSYVRTIERKFCLATDGLIGWECTFENKFPTSSLFKRTATLFWLASFVLTVLALFVLPAYELR